MPDINQTDLVAILRALNEEYGLRSDPIGYCAGVCREAADAIEALMRERTSLIETKREQLASQAAEISRLRDALSFYAHADTYAAIAFLADRPAGEFMDDFSFDADFDREMPGRRARTALEANHG